VKSIQPSSQFADDDGSADDELTRLLVPVLAELGVAEQNPDGLTVDKEASSGVVALEAPDGRRALPVFTSVAAMQAWRATPRPARAARRRCRRSTRTGR
jgi:hypothetical protein